VLDAEDKDAYAIIAHFLLQDDSLDSDESSGHDQPLDRRKVVDFANEYMSLAFDCGIHPIAFCKTAQDWRCRDSESFAFIALDESQTCHLGEKPNQQARIAYAERCIAPVLEKLEILTKDVPLSAHSCKVNVCRFGMLSNDLTDDELKCWKASASIELLGDILAYHIPVLCRSRRLPHLVLAAKAVALGAPYLQRTEATRKVSLWPKGVDDPRFLEFEQESKKKIPEQLEVATLLRKLFKHAASALQAEDQERLEQCIEGLEALEELSPERAKVHLQEIQEGLANQASIQAADHREYLEEWFKDHGLVTAGSRPEEFCMEQTEHSGAPYDSFTLWLKLIELAAAWAFDPFGPVERALAILGYVSAQSIKQGATTASHMKELRSACLDIYEHLASSRLEEHNNRAEAIKAFLAEGHFATEEDLKEWFGVQELEVSFHQGAFEFVPTSDSLARYISTSHAFKTIQLARVLAVDSEVPIEQALAVLRYVSAQAVEQYAPPSHLAALHSACSEIADQLASSDASGLRDRAAAIETFLAEGHFAIRE